MTALSHPDIPGLTVEPVGDLIHLVVRTDHDATLVALSDESAQRLGELLCDLADALNAGWASTASPQPSAADSASSGATPPETRS